MFVTFAGGYSRKPLPAQPDVLGDAERAVAAGHLDGAGYEAVADEYVREILAEMAVVEVAIVGDGGVRARDRVLPWIQGLDGLAAGADATLPDGELVTLPLVIGPVRWTRPLTVRDWQFADGETDLYVKQTMIGPYSLAALAEPAAGPRRANLAIQFAEALNQEIRALSGAGCALVEIDEPLILAAGDAAEEWTAFRRSHERLTAGVDDRSLMHLSLGLWGGSIDSAGHAPLIDLPYSSYLVDVFPGPPAWRFIAAVPPERGIVVGAADAHSERPEETEVLVWAMAWAARGGRGQERVGLAPNGSLTFIDRHFAHRKLQRLSEAVNIARMGPLQDVAEALDEKPLASRMAELRSMAHAVAIADAE